MTPNRKGTAFHEAGHAVACWALRVPFKRISIRPEADSWGRVTIGQDPQGFEHSESAAENQAWAHRRIITLYAGELAEAKAETGGDPEGATEDHSLAADYALHVSATEAEASALAAWLFERARNLIGNPLNWAAIEAVAQALADRESIGPRRARAIMAEAQGQALAAKGGGK